MVFRRIYQPKISCQALGPENTKQHLSVYDTLATIKGPELTLRALAGGPEIGFDLRNRALFNAVV